MPAKYYELLYHCRDASRLISFGLQVRRWKHGQFLALLEGKDPLVLPALQDAPVELDPDPDEASDMEELPAPSDHPAIRHVPIADRSQVRAPVALSDLEGGQNATVMFDGGSHQSGKERAYIKCQCHSGEGCVKYRFVHHFDSDRECVSWLMSWKLDGSRSVSREEHIKTSPPADLQARILQLVPDA